MCCFSQPVEHVSSTQIFARATGDKQFLVYSMSITARQDLAMILPLPVPPGSAEDAVRFINLEGYPRFFDDLRQLFEEPMAFASGGIPLRGPPRALVVHDVGMFEASFVPSIADFKRLDPRFRLPPEVWSKLPQYKDWGFAVFKLKRPRKSAGGSGSWLRRLFGSSTAKTGSADAHASAEAQRIHPMAFEFPRRERNQLFFPTVHIHDGVVHAEAAFDHTLYCQLADSPPPSTKKSIRGLDEITLRSWDQKQKSFHSSSWEQSNRALAAAMNLERTGALLDENAPVYRLRLGGKQTNQDTVIDSGS